MKNLYLFLIIFLSLQVNGQFFEGFENVNFPPAGWVVADNGVGTNVSWGSNMAPFPAYEGNRCAYINRENILAGNTSEDWLITPAITVGANASLNFTSRQTLMGDTGALYQVRISTSSQTDQSSFTTVAPYTEQTINSGLDYETKSISLNAFAGQTVYIAFVKIFTQPTLATSGDRWLLDNVMIGDVNSLNTISGNISYSPDGICNSSLIPLSSGSVAIGYNSDVNNIFINPSNGNFSYRTFANALTVTPNISISNYFTITPTTQTVNFSSAGSTETANFCVIPNGEHNDLEVNLICLRPARPGFDARYLIIYKNKGTTTQSGTVTFNFNDALMDYVSSFTTPSNVQTGLLIWSYSDLAPFERRFVDFTLNINSSLENPPVNIGDLLTYSAHVTSPATDETDPDNYATLTQTVVGSFDPNDKQVSALTYYYEFAAVEDLSYTIRFQNLGTFLAENVVVADFLSDKLDATTLQLVSSSHPYVSRYNTVTRKLEFIFEGINLPAAIDNEPESNGYVSFKIKPMLTVQPGETVENKADIFFDFNEPITTNTVSTLFQTLLQTTDFTNSIYSIHPNPATNIINMAATSGVNIQSIAIYNPLGQLVKTLTDGELRSSLSIDVSALKTGTYFMEINSNQGKTTKKFVKL